ncbi:unnamed protein product, partial [Didymodactylos carnosus]
RPGRPPKRNPLMLDSYQDEKRAKLSANFLLRTFPEFAAQTLKYPVYNSFIPYSSNDGNNVQPFVHSYSYSAFSPTVPRGIGFLSQATDHSNDSNTIDSKFPQKHEQHLHHPHLNTLQHHPDDTLRLKLTSSSDLKVPSPSYKNLLSRGRKQKKALVKRVYQEIFIQLKIRLMN